MMNAQVSFYRMTVAARRDVAHDVSNSVFSDFVTDALCSPQQERKLFEGDGFGGEFSVADAVTDDVNYRRLTDGELVRRDQVDQLRAWGDGFLNIRAWKTFLLIAGDLVKLSPLIGFQ